MNELKNEIIEKYGVNEEDINEVKMGDSKYWHIFHDEQDCLFGIDDKGIKVTLRFTRDKEKHEKAIDAIKTFFSYL